MSSRSLALAPLLLLLAACAPSLPDFEPFESTRDGYVVDMRGTPESDSQPMPTPFGEGERRLQMARTEAREFNVVVYDLPAEAANRLDPQALITSMGASRGTKVRSSEEIQAHGARTTEIVLDSSDNGEMVMHFFRDGDRYFGLLVTHVDGPGGAEDRDRFFGSFRLR